MALCAQPLTVSQLSFVHGLLSSQLTVAWSQTPAAHESAVHASLSLQFMAVCEQPVTLSQASTVHGFESSQLMGELEQAPDWGSQESAVHASSSLQDLAMCAQPVFGSQESAVHALLSSQLTGTVPAMHVPAAQCSPVKQALPSVQLFALLGVPTQPPPTGSQASSVHELPSSHPVVGPGTQAPLALHKPSEQASESEQVVLR
jgi:hypothetical protein